MQISGPEGQPLTALQVMVAAVPPFLGERLARWVNQPLPTDHAGTTLIGKLAAGVYSVSVLGRDEVAPVQVAVSEGETTSLAIQLP